MHKEAEMIENMAKQGGGPPGQSSGGPPGDKSGDKSNAPPVSYPGYNNYGGGYGGDKNH